jgi:hypothetical protein
MATSRALALAAFAAFLIFFGVVLVKVPRIDLSVAILIGLALAGYDLWTQLGPGRRP